MRARARTRTVASMIVATTTRREVTGHGGVRIAVREGGDPAGPPLLFVHGWSQCQLCWDRQFAGPLAARFRLVSFDLRGHGSSEAPDAAEAYTDQRAWAGDVAAVIEALDLDGAIAVAWSYGGAVITDYIREHGAEHLAGIDLVGAAVQLGPSGAGRFGPGLVENAASMCDEDLAVAIPALDRFLRACTAQPLAQDDRTRALCWNMAVRPAVRGALISRDVDATDVLAGLSIPVLVTHGLADQIVLPSMGEHALAVCPSARASWYDGIGHAPFLEAPERFDRELAAFAADRPR
jgi:pimeloyl-ACP methyl ester carboxylesterase